VLRHRISYYATRHGDRDVEQRARLRHGSRRPELGRHSRVRQHAAAAVPLLRSLLDGELAGIYGQLQKGGWRQNWSGRRYTRAARHVHSLFIDVNELTDRAENALKIAGDVYVARLFAMTAARIGLEQWRATCAKS
jgi:N-formylglutamate amidohydrolase